jgi:ferredoxin-NADP reductase
MRWLASLCGVMRSGTPKPVGVFPDPNSEKAEAYVTSNAAAKAEDGGVFAVTVTSIEDDSPNTKLITLVVVNDKKKFAFRPGQWVDFHAPGVTKPGGYSIASSHGRFVKDGSFQLAIRESRSSACAHWVHGKCKKGDEAKVCVGGKFFASRKDLTHPLILVAGGIGIAPILGIVQTFSEEQLHGSNPGGSNDDNTGNTSRGTSSTPQKRNTNTLRVVLLCSTKNPQTQPMLREILAAVRDANGAVKCVFHRTDGRGSCDGIKDKEYDNKKVSVKKGRIERDALSDALSALRGDGKHSKKPIAFLCGPPALSDATEASLLALGVPKEDVRLERWW